MSDDASERPRDFIRAMVAEDLEAGTVQRVVTRFPPEPNGFPHIGHSKSICLNFGLAQEFDGVCHLRFDDTNPETEDMKYVEAMQRDIRWLGFDWGDKLFFASDYFPRFYECAVELVKKGVAYVCDLSDEEFREHRGTVTEVGKPSPYRERSVEENLDLFARMKAGEFANGSRVLRAHIDMASPNMKMRDPPIYRIKKGASHYRTGTEWCIYPIYDFAHPLGDAFEGITHSLCTLEFENNRELYDWYLDQLGFDPRPYQTEFARLSLEYAVMSKRYLLQLVEEGHVSGWDDPRMPTIAGYRRRGVPAAAIRRFCEDVGIAKANSTVELAQFDHAVRDELNTTAPRRMAVLEPLKVTITNYPEGETEELDAPDWPHDVGKAGSRKVPFGRTIYLERGDFAEEPPKGWRRLSPGEEVRLRYAYFLRCDEVVKDDAGEVVELRCSYDPDTRGGKAADGRKVKGTLHWVAAHGAVDAEVRVYDVLISEPSPSKENFLACLNPDSLRTLTGCKLEPALGALAPGDRVQFERQGFFVTDSEDHAEGAPVFNRIVALKDSWARKTADAPPPRRRSKAEPAAEVVERDHAAELSGDALAAYQRLTGELGLGEEPARVLCEPGPLQSLFEGAVAAGAPAVPTANLLTNDVRRARKAGEVEDVPFDGAALAELVALGEDGTLSSKGVRQALAGMLAGEGSAADVVAARGLAALSDPAEIGALVDEVMAAHPDKVEAYRGGKAGLKGFFVGQVMKASQGKADPPVVQQVLTEKLG